MLHVLPQKTGDTKKLFQMMAMFTLIVVMVSQVYVYAQTHHIAYIKGVHFCASIIGQ